MTKLMLKVLHGNCVDEVPIWIMRQAGRYLPQYRNIRSKFANFMDFCLTPEAAAEVTMQPIEIFGMDAAIIFSDILVVPKAMGMRVEFIEGIGPKLDGISHHSEIEMYSKFDVEIFNKIATSIAITKRIIDSKYPNTALIGFAGGPFTVAAYMIDGGGSRDFAKTMIFMIQNKQYFDKLMNYIVYATIQYLSLQLSAGAEIIKIFDSWASLVPEHLFKAYVIAPINKIIKEVRLLHKDIPIIVFTRGAGTRMEVPDGASCMAIDQYTDLLWCKKKFQNCKKLALQGNYDNFSLAYSKKPDIKHDVENILGKMTDVPYIFNLGHGILPATPVDNLKYLIDIVRKWTANK